MPPPQRLQRSKSTLFNRYPHLFRSAKEWAEQRNSESVGGLKLLSFGCSDGSEMASLSAYFPDATILGCDISDEGYRENVSASRSGRYFNSTPEEIAAHGPFDIIFANSVLCSYPLRTEIHLELPFDVFDKWLSDLSNSLKRDGLLVICNASYFIQESRQFHQFRSVRTPLIYSNGWVPKWTSNHVLVTDIAPDGAKSFVNTVPDPMWHVDCMFEKSTGSPINIDIGCRSPEHLTLIAEKSIDHTGCRLDISLHKDNRDEIYYRRQSWHIPVSSTEFIEGPSWWERTSKDSMLFPAPLPFDTAPPRPKGALLPKEATSSPERSLRGFLKRFLTS